MKLIAITIKILLTVGLFLSIFTSCHTVQDMSKPSKSTSKPSETIAQENLTMIILLKKGKDAAYLKSTYKTYRPSDVKRANRTLNQYSVKFSCSQKEKGALLKKLENDVNVMKTSISSRTETNVQSGKNQSHSKTPPIRNN